MRREDNLMLCTIKELSNFVVENISGLGERLPTDLMTLKTRYDFAVVDVCGNADEYNLREIYQAAWGWHGIDEIEVPFDQDRRYYIDLIVGCYGGGRYEHVTIWRETDCADLTIEKIIETVLEIDEHVDDNTVLIVEAISNY